MLESRLPVNGRLVFGVVVIVLGVLFTLDSVGLLDAGRVLRWWPVVPILYGVARLTGFNCRQNTLAGAIFTIAGALILLHDFDVIGLDPWSLFWPFVLLAVGFAMVRGSLRRQRLRGAGVGGPGAPPGDPGSSRVHGPGGAFASAMGLGDVGGGTGADVTLNTFVMWSGLERKVSSQEFRGGDVTAIMGGAEIDLRQARLAGGEAVVEVLVLWGGVDFFVPADWKVTVEAMPLLGGIEDSTRLTAGETRGHLVIRGLVMMGGVEVKN
jgi:hypothetical protein